MEIMEDGRPRLAFLQRKLITLLACAAAATIFSAAPTTAHAMRAVSAKAGRPALALPTGDCEIHTLPSFIDQGLEAEASSVADIIEVECNPLEYDGTITIADTELLNRCGKGTHLSWSPANEFKPTIGPATEAKLDDDGNATVVLWAGPECKPGETAIVVDQNTYPFETYMSSFTVLPPEPTEEGVFALPSKKVEDDVFSSVATIIQVEFPIVETKVSINAEQLFSRCGKAPHVIWVGPNEHKITEGEGRLEGAHALETDDDGNAFVVALGAKSCQPGKVTIEASLEEAESFNSVFTTFEIEFPRVTVEETAFKVEKEQKLPGEPNFTKKKLIGNLHEIVDYKVIVTNTGTLPITLANIHDPNCTHIVGPEKAELLPHEHTAYTCEHELTSIGVYVNEAEVETTEHLKEKSNKVEVEVPPHVAFTVEKEQKTPAEGAFTKSKLTGKKVGEIVEYLIRVTNTGNTTIKLAAINDPKCTHIVGPLKAELAPGESTTYTCEHELTTVGVYVNEAEVETTEHLKEKSKKVEVEVPPGPALTVEKEQKISTEAAFTKERLSGKKIGEVVDYKIIVKNVGTVPITLANIADGNCTNIVGPAKAELAPHESTFYTCEHELTTVGVYVNEAEVETTEHLKEKSNKVEVEVPEPAAPEQISVEKEQKIGAGSFTKSKLVGHLKEVVDYKVIVKDIGLSRVTLTSISDPNCTNIKGPAQTELGIGESTFYTCEHELTTLGTYTNEAEVETAKKERAKSNKVEVEVTAVPGPPPAVLLPPPPPPKLEVKPECKVAVSSIRLRGVKADERKPFTVQVSAVGVKEVTIYLDRHKLRTLKTGQAKHGVFSIKINTRKLSFGGHKIVVRVAAKEAICKPVVRSAVFVHPKSSGVSPNFTG